MLYQSICIFTVIWLLHIETFEYIDRKALTFWTWDHSGIIHSQFHRLMCKSQYILYCTSESDTNIYTKCVKLLFTILMTPLYPSTLTGVIVRLSMPIVCVWWSDFNTLAIFRIGTLWAWIYSTTTMSFPLHCEAFCHYQLTSGLTTKCFVRLTIHKLFSRRRYTSFRRANICGSVIRKNEINRIIKSELTDQNVICV